MTRVQFPDGKFFSRSSCCFAFLQPAPFFGVNSHLICDLVPAEGDSMQNSHILTERGGRETDGEGVYTTKREVVEREEGRMLSGRLWNVKLTNPSPIRLTMSCEMSEKVSKERDDKNG